VLLNARAETMFGYTRAELIGQPVELLIPKRLGERHVAHRATYMAAPRVRPMGQGLDLIGLRKDGSAFPVEVSLSFRADPMKEPALSPSSPTSASGASSRSRTAPGSAVHEHHGTVDVNSEVGKGTAFTLTFPLDASSG
jgi:PAS domain-containing protein